MSSGLVLNSTNINSQITTNGTNFPALNIPNTEQSTGELDLTLSATGTITKDSTDAEKESVIKAIQDTYKDSSLATESLYASIINSTTPVALAEQLVLDKTSAIST